MDQDLESRPNTALLPSYLGFSKYSQMMTVPRGKTTSKNRLKPLLRFYDILNYLLCVGVEGIPCPFHPALKSCLLCSLLYRHKTNGSCCHRDFTLRAAQQRAVLRCDLQNTTVGFTKVNSMYIQGIGSEIICRDAKLG